MGKKVILAAPCAHVFWDQKFKLCSDSFRTKEINYCFSSYAAPAKVLDHMFHWGKLNSNPRVNETGLVSYSTILQGICKHFLPSFIQTATMFNNFLQLYLVRDMGMCETVETVEKYIENEGVSSISTYLLPSQGQHRLPVT